MEYLKFPYDINNLDKRYYLTNSTGLKFFKLCKKGAAKKVVNVDTYIYNNKYYQVLYIDFTDKKICLKEVKIKNISKKYCELA